MGPGLDQRQKVGSIVCFAVGSSHHEKGIASHLVKCDGESDAVWQQHDQFH